jgi:cytochrome c-type biogenesis protein CcmH/NrfG
MKADHLGKNNASLGYTHDFLADVYINLKDDAKAIHSLEEAMRLKGGEDIVTLEKLSGFY